MESAVAVKRRDLRHDAVQVRRIQAGVRAGRTGARHRDSVGGRTAAARSAPAGRARRDRPARPGRRPCSSSPIRRPRRCAPTGRTPARPTRTGRSRATLASCSSPTGGSVSATIAVAPMKPKFQPRPSRTRPVQNCQTARPDRETAALAARSTRPVATMRSLPKRCDQPAGEEARAEHRQDVPLDAERADVLATGRSRPWPAARRSSRSSSGEAADAAAQAGQEPRLRHDRGQRPRGQEIGADAPRRDFGNAQEGQDGGAGKAKENQPDERPGKSAGRNRSAE